MTTRIPINVTRSALALVLSAGTLASSSFAFDFGRWPAHMPARTDSRHGRAVTRIMNPNELRGRVHEEVVAELAALGPEAATTLFAYMTGTIEGPQPDFSEPPPGDPDDPRFAHALPREDVILLDALAALPAEKVVPQITSAALHGGVDVKIVAMRCLGEFGGASAVDAWLDLMTSLEPLHLERAYVHAPTEGALGAILRRDPAALALLSTRVKQAEARILPAIVRSVSESRNARGVPVLLALLGRDSALDRVVLSETARLAEETIGTLPEDQLNWMRPFAVDDDWLVRREALAALGRLGDFRSWPTIVEALGDGQRLVSQTAAWSLRRMSGKDFGADAAAWTEWFESELSWFEDDGARWTRVLEDTEAARVLEAVGHLAEHPLFRHEIGSSLAPLLRRDDRQLVLALVAVLGNLGTRTVAGPLVGLLARDDEELRLAAWAALQKLTGEKLPRDSAAWSAYVSG